MPGRPPNPQRQEIRDLYAAGHRKVDIADKLGLSIKAVAWNTQDMEPVAARMEVTLNGRRLRDVGVKRGNVSQLSPETMEWLVSNTRGNDTIMQTFDKLVRNHHAKV
jgi:uncharacterized protein YjcR